MSFNPFAGGVIQRIAPTTAAQKEVLASAQMSDESNTAFNEAVSIRLTGGPIDQELLDQSLQTLVQRHESLRITFSRRGDEICLQESKVALQVVDLTEQDKAQQIDYLEHLKKNIAISPMNLEEGPLCYVWLVRLGNERFELILVVHHVICDGWSLGLLLDELAYIYSNGGGIHGLPNVPSFMDYADLQNASIAANIDIDYWRQAFELVPDNIDLPLDKPRPSHRTFTATRVDFELGAELSSELKVVAASLKSSQVNVVLAVYFLLLNRLSQKDDLIVGLPVAGQAATNQVSLVGHLVQLLPIRVQMTEQWSFRQLLEMVKSKVLDASERPNFTFGELVKDKEVDRSRVPLINTIFNIDQAMPELDFGGAKGVACTIPRAAENFEIFLNVVPRENGLTIEATYSTCLFDENTICAWLDALKFLLTQALSDPDKALSAFSLSSQLPAVVEERNNTKVELVYSSILSAIKFQTEATPEAIALRVGSVSLSYSELLSKVQQVAQRLRTEGLGENEVIGICSSRCAEMLISVLAVHQVGAAYLPLDPSFPVGRLKYMLQDSGAKAILGDDNAESIFNSSDTDIELITFDRLFEGGEDSPAEGAFYPSEREDRLAYLIYTSGSTGQPKGVAISSRSVMNFLQSMKIQPGCGPEDVLLAVTTLAFDISVLELFLPLISGATVILATDEDAKDGEVLSEIIASQGVTLMQATPATWRMLLASSWGKQQHSGLKALCGGEPLTASLAEDLLAHVSELWNMYGPTETTVWSSCKQIIPPVQHVTVGSAIQNTQLLLLDSHLHAVPLSTPGEICIGGDGLAVAYHNRPELTAEKFIEHPVFGRIYRTGDIGKWTSEGELVHLGRLDDQIKVRGYRIELGEIEKALEEQEGVERAFVYLWQLRDDDARVVACCIPHGGGTFKTAKLRKVLRGRLPSYMVPQYFLTINEVPLTPNGKLDRKKLPRPEITSSSLVGEALSSETEKAIAHIWRDLLQSSVSIGRDDSFFEVGGHSLLALESIRQIESHFGKQFSMRDMVSLKLSNLAEEIDASSYAEENDKTGPVALSVQANRRPSAEQKTLFEYQLSHPSSVDFNLPASWRLKGTLDLSLFQQAFCRVLQRQTALRSCFKVDSGQLLTAILPIDQQDWLIVEDYSDLELDDAVSRCISLASTPFDLSQSPLFRARIFKLADDDWLFFICPHQLIFDGWSFDILLKEVEQSYTSLTKKQSSPLTKLPYEFRDYCHWRYELHAAKDYKLMACKAYHQKAMAIDAWVDVNGGDFSKGFGRSSATLGESELNQIESFCLQNNIRMHDCITAAYIEALFSLNTASELNIALPVTGRYYPEVIGLIGGFVSSLPFYCERPVEGQFVDQCKSTSANLTKFHDNQDITFSELAEGADSDFRPLSSFVPSSLAFQDIRNRPERLDSLTVEQIDISRAGSMFALETWIRIEQGQVRIVADYRKNCFDTEFVEQLVRKMQKRMRDLSAPSELSTNEMQESNGVQKSFWKRLFK